MMATTGFIQGIDHLNVDTVIFLEMPYGLNNLVQGAGRAGHAGRPAHVFLIDYCTTFAHHKMVALTAVLLKRVLNLPRICRLSMHNSFQCHGWVAHHLL